MKLAEHPDLQNLRVDADLSALVPAPIDGKRNGATFVTRPSWLVDRDLFTLAPDGDVFGGWHSPSPDDQPLMDALQLQLRTSGEERDASQEQTDAQADMARHLDAITLADEDVLLARPPFMPDVTLIYVGIEGADGQTAIREGLFHAEFDGESGWSVTSFDYGSDQIHLLNKTFPLRVAGHELCYLRYFLQVVRGPEGAFRVIDRSLKQALFALMQQNDEAEAADQAFENWHPLKLTGLGNDGGLEYEAYVLYGGAIVWVRFLVLSDGNVSMTDDIVQMNKQFPFLREV